MDIDGSIHELDQNETYKYQRIDEGNRIQHSKMKEKIKKYCYRRVRAILKKRINLI